MCLFSILIFILGTMPSLLEVQFYFAQNIELFDRLFGTCQQQYATDNRKGGTKTVDLYSRYSSIKKAISFREISRLK